MSGKQFPVPDGFNIQPKAPAHPPQSRRVAPTFRSDFALSDATSSNARPSKQKQKQTPRGRPFHLDCRPQNDSLRSRSARDALVPKENAPAVDPTRVLSPPPIPVPVPVPVLQPSNFTKILSPPILFSPPRRPCTPPKNLAEPDLSKFRSPPHGPSRRSKPVSETRIALATDLWTDGGRADLLGLTLEQDGAQYATPMEKAVRRGLEVSPRKVGGIGKEIRYASGGLAERASRVIGRKTTALSLWRRSAPSPESANMIVQIEEIIDAPKPAPQRGATGMVLCLARCWVREEDKSVLVLFSVPAHDARTVAIRDLRVGGSVGLWEPLLGDEDSGMLCSRFVVI